VSDKVSNPLGIFDISLSTGHTLDVLGIADDQLKVTFEDGVDRHPVDARTLHPDMSAAFREQPVTQST
jgi:hypothetical protein